MKIKTIEGSPKGYVVVIYYGGSQYGVRRLNGSLETYYECELVHVTEKE